MTRAKLPLHITLLLVTQMLFSIGFYLVVPFLAVQLSENLGASGAIVGLVLGIRTFSQQGLFFFGGGLADKFGAGPILLIGVAIRVIGFLTVGMAETVTLMTLGVVLIGFAAALFSPAVESIFAAEGHRLEKLGVITRARLFALDAAYSRIGTLTGPVIGAVLIPLGFATVSIAGAAIFGSIFVIHLALRRTWTASAQPQRTHAPSMVAVWGEVIRNKKFVVFALLYSTYLLAYNQQYLSLPVELRRATGSDEALGWFFAVSAVFVIALQSRVTRWAERQAATVALGGGFGLMALSFAVVAGASISLELEGWIAYVPATVMMILLHTGIMIAVPIARDLVGDLAGNNNLGSYYGFLNSFGGLAVLLGSLTVGATLDHAETTQPMAAIPWLIMVAVLAVSAVGLAQLKEKQKVDITQ
ncbi:MFS transporter [Corynebacterium diphtheriae]|nr:MFS transporter [Corynebacterium diphtheriae]CAB1029028.1 MFS transporter [Corynebacterium diphtheriae]